MLAKNNSFGAGLIPLRGWAALAILALLCFAASKSHAEDTKPIQPRHQSPGALTCKVVRDFVAIVGPEQAEKIARDGGASDARIAAARKCLQDAK
jgi:hypothetical protein